MDEMSAPLEKISRGMDLFGMKMPKMATTLTAVFATSAVALTKAGVEVSKLQNQFIAFAGTAEGAGEMYNKFNDVARNMNSSYNEQQIYDMGKALMAVGISADEAASVITKTTNAAAHLGKGAEFAKELQEALIRLNTGGQLTEKQFKAIAEAGLDLSNIEEQMVQGGMAGYQALNEELAKYDGAMDNTKRTATEMTADISANCTELLRGTAQLVDEFFGFSDALKELFQWIIDITNEAVSSIRRMINAMRDAKATSSAFADAYNEWESIYGDSFQGTNEEREAAKQAYANATADVVVEAEKRKKEAIEETTAAAKRQVKAISAKGGAGSGRGGGGSRTSTAVEKDPFKSIEELRVAALKLTEDMHAANMQRLENELDMGEVSKAAYQNKVMSEMKTFAEQCQWELDHAELTADERLRIETNLANATKYIRENSLKDFKDIWADVMDELNETTFNQVDTIKNGIKDLAEDFVGFGQNLLTDSQSLTERINGLFKNLANDIMNTMMKVYMQGLFSKMFSGLGGLFGAADGGYVGVRAFAGGGYAGAGWGLVGERGPELVNFSQPGRVYNAEQTANALGRGGTVNIKFNLENNTGTPMEAQQTGTQFDGESYIIGVVLNAVANNKQGMRTILKGM